MITLILIFISGLLNASMNSVRIYYKKSIFNKLFPKNRQFFDESVSWRNQFKKDTRNRVPRFIFSNTYLSFVTDFYSLCRFFMVLCFIIGIINYTQIVNPIADVILLYLVYSIANEQGKKFMVK